jgi:hypothetical protein
VRRRPSPTERGWEREEGGTDGAARVPPRPWRSADGPEGQMALEEEEAECDRIVTNHDRTCGGSLIKSCVTGRTIG